MQRAMRQPQGRIEELQGGREEGEAARLQPHPEQLRTHTHHHLRALVCYYMTIRISNILVYYYVVDERANVSVDIAH